MVKFTLCSSTMDDKSIDPALRDVKNTTLEVDITGMTRRDLIAKVFHRFPRGEVLRAQHLEYHKAVGTERILYVSSMSASSRFCGIVAHHFDGGDWDAVAKQYPNVEDPIMTTQAFAALKSVEALLAAAQSNYSKVEPENKDAATKAEPDAVPQNGVAKTETSVEVAALKQKLEQATSLIEKLKQLRALSLDIESLHRENHVLRKREEKLNRRLAAATADRESSEKTIEIACTQENSLVKEITDLEKTLN